MPPQQSASPVDRAQQIALLVGLAGFAAGIFGSFTSGLDRFFQAYLVAFIFWVGISLGSLAFLMIYFVTQGRWGLTMRRVHEAASSTLWLMAILFIPLLFDLPGLYVWARPEAVQASAVLQEKSLYLNEPFFIARAAFYFIVWIVLSFFINRLSAAYSRSATPALKSRLQGLSTFGLIVYTFTMTFAAIDWVMSLEPLWNSTVFGLTIILGQLLSSLSFGVWMLNLSPGLGLGRKWGSRSTPLPYKDLGSMMLTFVIGWAYLAYFQLLIIWAGNIPREVTWYVERSTGGWLTVGLLVAILQFVLPFALLLSMRVRHNLRYLAWLGAAIFIVYFINVYWQMIPSFSPGQFSLEWFDLILPIGFGGLWVGVFLFSLKRRPALSAIEQQSLDVRSGHEHDVSETPPVQF